MPIIQQKPSTNGKPHNKASSNGYVSPRHVTSVSSAGSAPVGQQTTLANRMRGHTAKPAFAPSNDKRTQFTATELMAMVLPEPQCIVHTLLTEGLSILVARPKLGKSWLALQLAVCIASGLFALGTLPVMQGDVLYLALEDNKRRLKQRLSKLLSGQPAPSRLTLATHWRRMDEGGLDELRKWIQHAECPRLIVVDTLAKVRPSKAKQADRYADDYKDVGDIQRLAEEYGIAILVIHHDRKAQAEDAMDDVSGSIGITAAADTLLLMRRERGTHDACLNVHGRDIEEQELALAWDATSCHWSLMDKSIKEARMSEARLKVLECVRDHGPITPKQTADKLNTKENNVKQLLHNLAKAGEVKSTGGKYTVTEASSN